MRASSCATGTKMELHSAKPVMERRFEAGAADAVARTPAVDV